MPAPLQADPRTAGDDPATRLSGMT